MCTASYVRFHRVTARRHSRDNALRSDHHNVVTRDTGILGPDVGGAGANRNFGLIPFGLGRRHGIAISALRLKSYRRDVYGVANDGIKDCARCPFGPASEPPNTPNQSEARLRKASSCPVAC